MLMLLMAMKPLNAIMAYGMTALALMALALIFFDTANSVFLKSERVSVAVFRMTFVTVIAAAFWIIGMVGVFGVLFFSAPGVSSLTTW